MKVFSYITNKKVLIILFSQSLTLFVSLIMTIGVTKTLGVTNYGYWQLFLLYLSYTGFFHLGVYDGIYLKYGGMQIENLNYSEVRSVFWYSIFVQLIFFMVSYIILSFGNNFQKGLTIAVIFTGFLNNIQYFLYFILLATNNIKQYSLSVIIEKSCLAVGIMFFIYFDFQNYYLLIVIYIAGKFLSLTNLFSYFSFLTKVTFGNSTKIFISFLKSGFLMMFSNIISALILGLPRLLIEKKWSINIFGKVSLAFSVVYFIIAILSQLSLILFPHLRNKDFLEQKKTYINLRGKISRTLMISIIFYFPVINILSQFLPDYEYSFVVFTYLIPIVLFDGLTQILYTSYFKTLNFQSKLFQINLIVMIVTIFLLSIVYYFFNSILLFLLVSVFSILLKSFLCKRTISSVYNLKYLNLFLFELFYALIITFIFIKESNLIYVIIIGMLLVWLHFKYIDSSNLKISHEK